MKILCICPIGIGNYLLCYPSWVHLKKHLPDAELHLLALRRQITGLADSDSLWSAVHCIEPTKRPSIREMMQFIMMLRRHRFDTSISFFPSNTWQYHLLPFLAGCSRRMAFRYPLKKTTSLSILASGFVDVDPSLHDVEQNLQIAAAVTGVHNSSSEKPLFPSLITHADSTKALELLPTGTRFFAIHPGSSAEHGMDAKRWPPERFGELADHICEELDATALLFGGPDEAPLKRSVAAAMTQSYTIIDPQPLPLTAALLQRCIFCLCNDSGIMHLAACSNVPVAAFFGPTDEKRNGPYGTTHCILRKPMKGFPLWTAANVGVRYIPEGTDPSRSLRELAVNDAWSIIKPFLTRLKH